MAFCILCGNNILVNTTRPFCNDCYAPLTNINQTFHVDGKYCHGCSDENNKISRHYPLCVNCSPFSRKDNSVNEYYLKEFERMRLMSLVERKSIVPLWTMPENSTSINKTLCLKELIIDDILEIIISARELNAVDIFKNEPQHIRRIMSILRAWKIGIPISPPKIKSAGTLIIEDGRHRILAAHFVGATIIPVYIKNTR